MIARDSARDGQCADGRNRDVVTAQNPWRRVLRRRPTRGRMDRDRRVLPRLEIRSRPDPRGAVAGDWTADNAPSQISGYQDTDGPVHIAADSFDRSRGVTMYQVDNLADVADPNKWRRLLPNGTYGAEGRLATMPISPPDQNFGELSFREIDGRPVLAALNLGGEGVECWRAQSSRGNIWQRRHTNRGWRHWAWPRSGALSVQWFRRPDANGNMPHLDKMGILVSQWTPWGQYNTQQVWANVIPTQ